MFAWVCIFLLVLDTTVLVLAHPLHFKNWYYLFGSCFLIVGASIHTFLSMKYTKLLHFLAFGIVLNFLFDWCILYFT
jgi:hypothetical protein